MAGYDDWDIYYGEGNKLLVIESELSLILPYIKAESSQPKNSTMTANV
jgi:hypothetical protein